MEKVISERVVSERIIKSGGGIPILGGVMNKFSNIQSAIGGLCIAPLLITLAFGVIIYSENFHKSSQTVEKLDLIQARDASDKKGLQKIIGTPEITKSVAAPQVGSALYYEYTKEEYREVEEVETETVTEVRDGQEIEKTVERTKLVEKWVEEESKEDWSEFKLGEIEVDPTDANLKMDFSEKTFLQPKYSSNFQPYSDNYKAEVGDTRIIIKYVPQNEEIIVIGDISSGSISSGEEFIISNYSDSELLKTLQSEESTLYWIMKFVAFALYFAGIMAILNPIIALADFIPFAGKLASMVASGIAFVLALMFVVAVTIFVKFWWLIILCGFFLMIFLIGALAFVVIQKQKK